MPAPVRPDDLVRLLRSGESATPRLIWHAPGERIELSGRVLATWASKIADLLQEEFEAGVGSTVLLDGSPHWRLMAWALGGWTVGATVVTCTDPDSGTSVRPSGPVDVLVADGSRFAAGEVDIEAETLVGLTRAALARTSPVPLPAGVVDEASTVLTYADQVDPYDRADDDDLALDGATQATYAALIRPAAAERIHLSGSLPFAEVLAQAASVWAAGGSVVLTDPAWEASQGGDAAAGDFAQTLRSEGVSALPD